MLDLSPTKLIIIFVVVIVLLGPKRLPQVARQLGAGWRKLVSLHQQVERELRESMPDLPSSQDIVRFARSPVTMLNQLAEFPRAPADDPVEDPGAPAPAGTAVDAEGGVEPARGEVGSAGASSAAAAEEPGDGHWPEDRASAASPARNDGNGANGASGGNGANAASGVSGANGASGGSLTRAPSGVPADLRALAADDPTMN